MSSTKVQIAELAEKVEKLEKRLKKDEKLELYMVKGQSQTWTERI